MAPPPRGTFDHVWSRFGLGQLEVGDATGTLWVEARGPATHA